MDKAYYWAIDWGDGSAIENVRNTDPGAPQNAATSAGIPHTFAHAGTYTITITANDNEGSWLAAFGFYDNTNGANVAANKAKVTKVISYIMPDMTRSGTTIPRYEWAYTFYNCTNITMGENFAFSGWDNVDTVGDYFAAYMFRGCSSDNFTMNNVFNLPQNIKTVGGRFAVNIFENCTGKSFTMSKVFNLPQGITATGIDFAAYMFDACRGGGFFVNDVFKLPLLNSESLTKTRVYSYIFRGVVNPQTRTAASIIGGNEIPNNKRFTFTDATGFADRIYIATNWGGDNVTRAAYSVEITWGALEYTYTDGTWNPETHEYEGSSGGWKCDSENGGRIMVINIGTNDVTVGYSYTEADNSISAGFTTDAAGNLPITSPINLPSNETRLAYLHLYGQPRGEMTSQTIGTVNITIGA